jgi:hypothetical protein
MQQEESGKELSLAFQYQVVLKDLGVLAPVKLVQFSRTIGYAFLFLIKLFQETVAQHFFAEVTFVKLFAQHGLVQ